MYDTVVDQIADRIFRISTCLPELAPGGFTVNQFLVDAEEPLLYHTGMRQLFPRVREAIARVLPVDRLRWVAFAHLEADECGAVDQVLEAAPHAEVAHGALGVMLSLEDMLPRPPRALEDGEVLELGGASLRRSVLEVATPHVPHNWESHVFFEQETRTLFCGDLCSQLGNPAAVTDQDLTDAAVAAEEMFWQTSLGPAVPTTYRRLADLEPSTLAIMHGASYNGDCAALLRGLADVYETRFGCGPGPQGSTVPTQAPPVGAPA